MSTSYCTAIPMTIEEVMAVTGWAKHVNKEGGTMLTNGVSYIEWGQFEYDGSQWCDFERWGGNDARDFEEKMGDRLLSEHDDAYWDQPWNELQDDDEDEEN